jgi:23S rRNA (adenine2503-C2)-methyltransferase
MNSDPRAENRAEPVATPPCLYSLSRSELFRLVASWDWSPVHAARIWRCLYLDLVEEIPAMTSLPVRLRARLAAETRLHVPRTLVAQDSADGFTRKYLLAPDATTRIETVLMRFTGRVTACVSSQAGCAMGCVFCATGQMGFQRHLTAGEIVAQAVHVARALRAGAETPRLRNLVFMGMGEPLQNYAAVLRAVDILIDPAGLALGAERITLSTVGVVPGILRLAAERRPVHLAVSLHAATQAERAALVPAARKWPLAELMAACRHYCSTLNRRIFFEWTLIAGRNDGADQAHAVGALLRGLPAQVNLIPLNPTAGFAAGPGGSDAARQFQRILADTYRLPSTIRQRRGIDIAAGCGQLAGAA